jgi:AmmeMemoRadiSam system protein B
LTEHAIEVQLPFLRARRPDVRVVPVCLSGLGRDDCLELGQQIADSIRALGKPVLIVSSTDMSHYVSAETARVLDQLALDRVLDLDPGGLYDVVTRRHISMCGYVPTTVWLAAVKALGAREAQLVGYTNSGEASGDFERVVGYAGALISEGKNW